MSISGRDNKCWFSPLVFMKDFHTTTWASKKSSGMNVAEYCDFFGFKKRPFSFHNKYIQLLLHLALDHSPIYVEYLSILVYKK